jgi:hypothetical protein
MAKLPHYLLRSKKRRERAVLGEEISTILNPTSHVQTVLATVTGEEMAAKICHGFQRVKLSDLVGGVTIEDEPVHDEGSSHERRGAALVLMVLEQVSKHGRAWTDALFRGRNRRFLPDGTTEYCPGKSAGGLAARLGVCPRQVDRYLQVLKALGVFAVHQGPKTSPERFKGREYAYAVFRWLADVPRAVSQRLARVWGAEKPRPQPNPPAAPQTRGELSASAAELAAKLLDQESRDAAPAAPAETTRERGSEAATARFLALFKPG